MSKREARLKSLLRKELQGFILLAYATAGAPDISPVANGYQSNWEAKHANPGFISHGNQELLCMRLAKHGHCKYIFWHEDHLGRGKKTLIVEPRHVHDKSLKPEAWCVGFDMGWLASYIRAEHGL